MDSLDDKTLLKKTLVMVAAMVGACVFVVGSISLLAMLVVGKATSAPPSDDRAQVSPAASQLPAAPATPKTPAKPSQI